MTQYSYKARKNTGELIAGELTGDSEQEIINQLRQLEYTPVKIDQAAIVKLKKAAEPKVGLFTSTRVTARDLTVFCSTLSSMIDAGITLLNGLNVTSEQLTNPKLADAVRKVGQQISDGSSFSESLASYPNIFSNFFVSMIRTGEVSGTLDSILREMAIYFEKQDNLRQTVKGMMTYPLVLLTACISVVILIVTFLMPQFVGIFTRAKVPLPLPTMIFYETGLWIKEYYMYYIPALIAAFFGIKALLKTDGGKDFYDRFILKVPLIGSLVNKSLVVRFCRTLGVLFDAGVPMLQSFKILEQVLENRVFTGIVGEIYNNVEKGEGIYTALVLRKEFPKDVSYMISVGEKTGNLGVMLHKIADFYESKVQFQVKELMTLIEPAFIVLMGGLVGSIMASVILPMFDMIKTIHQ